MTHADLDKIGNHVTVDHYGSLWIIMDHYGSLLVRVQTIHSSAFQNPVKKFNAVFSFLSIPGMGNSPFRTFCCLYLD